MTMSKQCSISSLVWQEYILSSTTKTEQSRLSTYSKALNSMRDLKISSRPI